MTCAATKAHVDIAIDDNGTWQDAFRFGTVGDTSWDLVGQNFRLDIKGSKDDVAPLLTVSTALGSIVVVDTALRIIQMNVADTAIQAVLPPGEYYYDLIMFDGSTPAVRIPLMGGELKVCHGITGG